MERSRLSLGSRPRGPRGSARYVAAVLCFLLVGSILAAGLHHHADGRDHSDCALCAAMHSPAHVVVAVASGDAPIYRVERVIIAGAARIPEGSLPATPSRAPPLA
jgi:hypothetical protein